MDIVSGRLMCGAESDELEFFDPKELPVDGVPPARAPLEDFLRGITGVVR